MRLLLALLFLLPAFLMPSPSTHFIVFTNDGTFYRLDPRTKEVEWLNRLDFKLMSLEITQPHLEQQPHTDSLIIPTMDGDFLYLHHHLDGHAVKEILLPREDIEELLDICFHNVQHHYFVYEKLEYYVLNLQNGQYQPLEDFLKAKQKLDREQHFIMVISKKLLKQMTERMEVKWNIISSTIALMNGDQFVKNPKAQQKIKPIDGMKIYRRNSKLIEIEDVENQVTMEIESSNPILNIFFANDQNQILKASIIHEEKKMLALESKPGVTIEGSVIPPELSSGENSPNFSFQHFPHSDDYSNPWSEQEALSNFEFCLNTYQILKANSRENKGFDFEQLKLPKSKPQLPTIPFSPDSHPRIIIPKEQPVALILLAVILLGLLVLGYFFLKTDRLNKIISQLGTENEEKFAEIKKKLGEYESVGKEMKKMFQINWQSMVLNRKNYFIFNGRFLNQNSWVYALPTAHSDIIHIEHELNILLNSSHKLLSKLYYYTRNEQYLLIFAEASPSINTLAELTKQQEEEFYKKSDSYQTIVKQIIELLAYLKSNKIYLESFVDESVFVEGMNLARIDIIPSLIQKSEEKIEKSLEQMGIDYFKYTLVSLIHRLGHKGSKFDVEVFEKQKMTEDEENFFLKDFYDFLLTSKKEASSDAFLAHPFLWDSEKKIRFISEFSNYLETNYDEAKLIKMESYCRKNGIIDYPWNKNFHALMIKQISNYRKYDFYSVRDLIRLLRNKISHFHELPKETKAIVGKTPEQFVEYFLSQFPKLLSFMHIYAQKKKWKLHIQ